MSRRPSEIYGKMSTPTLPHKAFNLEQYCKHCNQILNKGPELTRDLLQKVRKNKSRILGRELETKTLLVVLGLFLLFLTSSVVAILMWCTNFFDNFAYAKQIIEPGSEGYDFWASPTVIAQTKIYIFNYTNVPEFENKQAEKLHVEEIGPYVYDIHAKKVNIKRNDTLLSYQEQRLYDFRPDLSQGLRQNDRVIVPNIPLFSAAAMHKHANFITRVGVSGLLNSLNARPFLSIAAHRFIVGYEDKLYALAKSYLKLHNQKPFNRSGLVVNSIGVSDDVITIHDGAESIDKLGQMARLNGKPALDLWSTDECNALNTATDGVNNPPRQIRSRKPLKLFFKEMCRTFTFNYDKNVTVLNGKIPAYRYVLPDNTFDHPSKNPANQCYCSLDSDECPPQGFFNETLCAFGAPIFISFPHWHNVDPEIRQGVTGLNPTPDVEGYKSYIDLHPVAGFLMSAKIRFQINIQVLRSFGISQVSMFDDGLMLPVGWIEVSIDDATLPDDVVTLIYKATFTRASAELGLRYGSLFSALVTLVCMLLIVKNRWRRGGVVV